MDTNFSSTRQELVVSGTSKSKNAGYETAGTNGGGVGEACKPGRIAPPAVVAIAAGGEAAGRVPAVQPAQALAPEPHAAPWLRAAAAPFAAAVVVVVAAAADADDDAAAAAGAAIFPAERTFAMSTHGEPPAHIRLQTAPKAVQGRALPSQAGAECPAIAGESPAGAAVGAAAGTPAAEDKQPD